MSNAAEDRRRVKRVVELKCVASKTSRITASRSSQVGSVGVVVTHTSVARLLKERGLDVTVISDPGGKISGHRIGRLTRTPHPAQWIHRQPAIAMGPIVRGLQCEGALARATAISIEAEQAERGYLDIAGTRDATPEQSFDRQWALTVLDRALKRLEQEQVAVVKASQFARLREFLSNAAEEGYDRAAADLGLKAGTVSVAVYRLRQRYRDLMRAEVAQTVAAGDRFNGEVRWRAGEFFPRHFPERERGAVAVVQHRSACVSCATMTKGEVNNSSAYSRGFETPGNKSRPSQCRKLRTSVVACATAQVDSQGSPMCGRG